MIEEMVWCFHNDELKPTNIETESDIDILTSWYPDVIYFYAGVELLPLED